MSLLPVLQEPQTKKELLQRKVEEEPTSCHWLPQWWVRERLWLQTKILRGLVLRPLRVLLLPLVLVLLVLEPPESSMNQRKTLLLLLLVEPVPERRVVQVLRELQRKTHPLVPESPGRVLRVLAPVPQTIRLHLQLLLVWVLLQQVSSIQRRILLLLLRVPVRASSIQRKIHRPQEQEPQVPV